MPKKNGAFQVEPAKAEDRTLEGVSVPQGWTIYAGAGVDTIEGHGRRVRVRSVHAWAWAWRLELERTRQRVADMASVAGDRSAEVLASKELQIEDLTHARKAALDEAWRLEQHGKQQANEIKDRDAAIRNLRARLEPQPVTLADLDHVLGSLCDRDVEPLRALGRRLLRRWAAAL